MDSKMIDLEYHRLLGEFGKDPELVKILNKVSHQDLFNPEFLTANSKFTSMDDILWRSGFGIMNLMEVEQVNQDKWNEYIGKNTDGRTWFEFGKMAMIDWMNKQIKAYEAEKNKEN